MTTVAKHTKPLTLRAGEARCRSAEEMRLVNALFEFVEAAEAQQRRY